MPVFLAAMILSQILAWASGKATVGQIPSSSSLSSNSPKFGKYPAKPRKTMTFGREADRIGPGVQHPAHEAARSSAARRDQRSIAPANFSIGRFIAEDPKSFPNLPYRHFRHVRFSQSSRTKGI